MQPLEARPLFPPVAYAPGDDGGGGVSVDGSCVCCQLVMCGAFYPNYFEQVASDEVEADREISGYNPCTTVMVCTLSYFYVSATCCIIIESFHISVALQRGNAVSFQNMFTAS